MEISLKIFLVLLGLSNYVSFNNVAAIKEEPYLVRMKPSDDNKSIPSNEDNSMETKPIESPENHKSLIFYRAQDSLKQLRNNKTPSGFQQVSIPKNYMEQDQQNIYSIKLPNQNFHNQAMQLNVDYKGYVTHDSPNFVQHPNQNFGQATKTYFDRTNPTNFAPHFEALTQNKEKPKDYSIREVYHNNPPQMKALSGNYYNTNIRHNNAQQSYVPQNYVRDENINLPQYESVQGTNYGSNIQHHQDQKHNNQNSYVENNEKPIEYGMSMTHFDKSGQHSAVFHDENNQMPSFEALTDYSNQHHAPNTETVNNGYKKHKNYFKNEEEPNNLKKSQHSEQSHHEEPPNNAVLWNHKIYHDDDYQRSYKEKYNTKPQQFHQSAHAINFNGNQANSKIVDFPSSKSKNTQKRSKHHRKNGNSLKKNEYLVNEQPEESQISQKNILPSTTKQENKREKFHINVKDETINQKLLEDHIANKSQVELLEKSPITEKTTLITHKKKTNEKNANIKPVHEDFDERDASPREISDEIRYFQDIYLAHKSPHVTEFGHVLETPETFEKRFELNDRKNHRYKGQIQWTNKNGEFGQQFWDLGHLGGK